jgi:hypothetical protein
MQSIYKLNELDPLITKKAGLNVLKPENVMLEKKSVAVGYVHKQISEFLPNDKPRNIDFQEGQHKS